MNKRALLVISVACVMALGAFSAAYAEGGKAMPPGPPMMKSGPPMGFEGPGHFRGRWHHGLSLKAMMKKLGITPEQKMKIRGMYIAFLNGSRKARMELKSLRDQKRTMILSGKIDQQKLAQIDDQIVKLRAEVMTAKLKLRRDRLAALTPEQQNRVADWAADMAFRAEARGGRCWGGKHHRGRRGGLGF